MGDHEENPAVPIVPEAALYDWAQPTAENLSTAIVVPQIQAELFQITNNMLHLLQNKGLFSGSQVEDPQQHLKNFLSICKTQRQPNVTPEAIKLLLFSFSVIGAAQTWLNSLPINSITTWDELVRQFHNKFHPPNKTAQQIDEILSFKQRPMETLHETWGRFKGMLVICPHHEHDHHHYPEDMNYVSNYGGQRQGGQNWGQQNQQYRPVHPQFNNGNMGGMRPPNNIAPYPRPQGYNNQNQQQGYHPPQQQHGGRQEDGFARLEAMMQQIIGFNAKTNERVDAHDASIKNIEVQVGQISLSLNNRPHGTLPADT
ncbi:uncharacterized protein [Nicotiana sylvestris]|uniref:uncharacterized protein n=1 Tax=Nicotiana sylvestris TaxID=4096 RepID=UPI00388C9555